MLSTAAILFCHVATVWFMTGAIWIVQRVHYPLFAWIGPPQFADLHAQHSRRITPVVAPAMLLELGSAVLLLWQRPAWDTAAAVALSLLCFALTGWVAVPLHQALGRGFDRTLVARLVATNRWRTAAWSLHALLTVVLVWRRGPG